MTKDKVSITLDAEVIAVLREEAKKEHMSLSRFLNQILRQHVQSVIKDQ